MKKFLFVVTFLISALSVAETATHTPSTDVSSVSTPVRTSVVTEDKSAKLIQYINACLVKRPSTEDEIRKLLQ